MTRFLAGDSAYFTELVKRHGPMVELVIRPFARDLDHFEDLFQQVWVNVFKYRRTFVCRGPFDSWLHRVARSVCLVDHGRLQGRSRGLARFRLHSRVEGPRSRNEDPLQRLERDERHARVHEALGALPRRELEAITLRRLDGRSVDEVASIMGIKKATVRSLIRHGIERLRRILEGYDEVS